MPIHRRRPGFTLIELIIVMGIMVIIAALGYMFLPNLNKNKGVPNATTQAEGWVRLARSQALRDGAPRGIRLIHDGGGRVTSMMYIEQPEPVAPRGPNVSITIMTPPPGTNAIVSLTGPDPNNPNQTIPKTWEGVQIGDYFELTVSPTVIARIIGVGGQNNSVLVLDRPIDGTDLGALNLSDGFRVIRAPRPLQGEPLLQMHRDVYIDLTLSSPYPTDLILQGIAPSAETNGYRSVANWSPNKDPNGVSYLDILFNSSGQVANAPTGQIMLTVVHNDRPTDRLVIVIYTRTGKVTAVNWNDIPGTDPFVFARDGKSAGL